MGVNCAPAKFRNWAEFFAPTVGVKSFQDTKINDMATMTTSMACELNMFYLGRIYIFPLRLLSLPDGSTYEVISRRRQGGRTARRRARRGVTDAVERTRPPTRTRTPSPQALPTTLFDLSCAAVVQREPDDFCQGSSKAMQSMRSSKPVTPRRSAAWPPG